MGLILKNSGFGIEFEKIGIGIWDSGLGFGIEFGKFRVEHSSPGPGEFYTMSKWVMLHQEIATPGNENGVESW